MAGKKSGDAKQILEKGLRAMHGSNLDASMASYKLSQHYKTYGGAVTFGMVKDYLKELSTT